MPDDNNPVPETPSPWEAAARSLLDARVSKLPEPFRELVRSYPPGTAPEQLIRFVEQAEKAASTGPPQPAPAPDVPSPEPRAPEPRQTDTRRAPSADSARADEHLWTELMKDGRRALELKRRRPDLYDALRRRFGGRRPNPHTTTRKDS